MYVCTNKLIIRSMYTISFIDTKNSGKKRLSLSLTWLSSETSWLNDESCPKTMIDAGHELFNATYLCDSMSLWLHFMLAIEVTMGDVLVKTRWVLRNWSLVDDANTCCCVLVQPSCRRLYSQGQCTVELSPLSVEAPFVGSWEIELLLHLEQTALGW